MYLYHKYLEEEKNNKQNSEDIDVFGPLPATIGDIPNRPKMTTKN